MSGIRFEALTGLLFAPFCATLTCVIKNSGGAAWV
jgi:hypothetical protein